jgi:hypothetical protein
MSAMELTIGVPETAQRLPARSEIALFERLLDIVRIICASSNIHTYIMDGRKWCHRGKKEIASKRSDVK